MAGTSQGNPQTVITRRRGSTQSGRMLPALDPSTAPVDGKSLAQNLAFLYEYADLLKLFGTTGGEAGTWAKMLRMDTSFLIASIQTTRIDGYTMRYAASMNLLKTPADATAQAVAASRLAGLVDALGHLLANWATRLPPSNADPLQLNATFKAILRSSIGSAITPWQSCVEALISLIPQNASEIAHAPLYADSIAISALLEPLLPAPAASSAQPVFSSVILCANYFSSLYQAFFRSVHQIQLQVDGLLERSLALPNHQPHNTLLLAFQQLMATATGAMNTLTGRHLDFYYTSVLQLAPLAAQPDSVFVQFSLNKGVASAVVPAQTALLAGKGENGANLLYLTDQEIAVNRVQATQFLSVSNSGAASPGQAQGLLYAAPLANSYDGQGAPFPKGMAAEWPAFSPPMAPAAVPTLVGFAVADPVLVMSTGTRSIALAFSLAATEVPALLLSLLPWLPTQGRASSVFSLSYTGPKGWCAVTDWSLAGQAPDWVAATGLPSTALWLAAVLDVNAPAIVAYDSALHGPGYTAGLPVLRFQLDAAQGLESPGSADVLHNPYNALQALRFSELDLYVDVQGKTDFLLFNDYAPVNAQKPYQPFGPAPLLGSNFFIGSPEAFRKALSSLTLRINWMQLPTGAFGFTGYYHVWNTVQPSKPLTTLGFRASVSLRQQNTWIPLPPSPTDGSATTAEDFQLFETQPSTTIDPSHPDNYQAQAWLAQNGGVAGNSPYAYGSLSSPPGSQSPPAADRIHNLMADGPLLSSTTFSDFDLSQLSPAALSQVPASSLDPQFEVDGTTATGCLRLSLSAPDYGFGSTMFGDVNFLVNQSNITYITESAKGQASSPPNLLAPPAPPYVPVAQSISVDYQAQSRLSAGGNQPGEFWLLQPFGVTPAIASGGTLPFFPAYPDAGVLYIGLAAVKAPQLLSLLVQVDENTAVEQAGTPLPDVQWRILVDKAWVPLRQSEFIADGTQNFSQSGIVQILLNHDAAPGTSPWFCGLDGMQGLVWLAATVSANAAATCKVIQIGTQAVKATYLLDANADSHLTQALPAGTITKMLTPLPGLAGVLQPLPSTGGQPSETAAQFYTRVHERLRHKNRGITPWDIERILLEDFPAINVVNCFPHSNLARPNVPGSTLVVVFPGQTVGRTNPYTPKFNLASIEAMQARLDDLIPMDMDALVTNPTYEPLTVVASLSFEAGLDPGVCLQQLQDELCAFIAPWAQDPDAYNPYDTLVSKALIRGFINGRSYVKRLVTLQVRQQAVVHGKTVQVLPKDDYAYFEPVNFHAIITSADQHLLGDADAVDPAHLPAMVIDTASTPVSETTPPPPDLASVPPVSVQEYLTILLY